jgi:ABC-type branched-subunit amino acid transport system ATPase component
VTILACEAVTKKFGALAAVDGFSMAVQAGEILGIGGPNGAGKTTLFDVMTGVTRATSGRVTLEGGDITALSPDRICHRGLARTFQLNAAFDSLSLRENVQVAAYNGRVRRLPGFALDHESRAAAEEALEAVGLTQGLDRLARDVPVLDRKLLMIAGALATRPRIVLLDEPVGGLAPQEIDRVIGVVRSIAARGVTVVLIEHVMRFLLALSQRVIIMHQGRTLYEGTPQGVAEDAGVVETYLGQGATARLKAHFAGTADA